MALAATGALFANLQATAAQGAGLDPKILLAANTIGGGLGKIVSPQNPAIASTAVDAPGSFAIPGAPCAHPRCDVGSRTSFPPEDCVLPPTTAPQHTHSDDKRSPRHKSTSPTASAALPSASPRPLPRIRAVMHDAIYI